MIERVPLTLSPCMIYLTQINLPVKALRVLDNTPTPYFDDLNECVCNL